MIERAYCAACNRTWPAGQGACEACAGPLAPYPADLDLGTVLEGGFRLVRLLDEGGMGAVFVGLQEDLQREVAVKVIRRALSRDPAIVRRFVEEGPTLARLEHPNTVRVYAQGRAPDGQLFLVMEMLKGKTLRDLLIDEGRLSLSRALRIGVQVCASLEEAHAKGLVHRDLKPEHVFLQDVAGHPDFVRVFDFGIARLDHEDDGPRVTEPGAVFGTIAYMSPEQANGEDVDARSDLYSLGILLHEALTGDPIFRSLNPLAVLMRKLTFEPTPLARRRPELEIPGGVDDLLMRLLAVGRDQRPGSAAEVREVLDACLGTAPVAAAPRAVAPVPASQGARATSEVARTQIGPRLSSRPHFAVSSCVGREAEKETLRAFLADVSEQRAPRVLLLDGPTGVGKSKLVDWLDQQVAGRTDVRIARGAYSHLGSSGSLSAVKDAIRALLEVDEDGALDGARVTARISTSLRRWEIADLALAGALADLLCPGAQSATHAREAGEERFWETTYAALVRVLREISAHARVLLVLDDVQWADARSLEFLQILLNAMQRHGIEVGLVLVVNSDEAEEQAAFTSFLVWVMRHLKPLVAPLTLRPLPQQDFGALAASVLPLEPATLDAIFGMCQGNPFFGLELIQFLYEEDGLLRANGRYRLRDEAERPREMPLTLRDVVQRKLARFRERHPVALQGVVVLEHLALYGDGLDVRLLEEVLDADRSGREVLDRLDEVLDALSGERLIRLGMRGQHEVLHSGHPLVAGYLRADMEGTRRARRMHRVFAERMEARLRHRDPATLQALAEHLRRGGEGARALPFYLEAGRLWRSLYEMERARACLERWRRYTLADREGSALAGDEVLEAYLDLAELQTIAGDFDAAEGSFRQVIAQVRPESEGNAYGRALLGVAEIRALDDVGAEADVRRAARHFRRRGDNLGLARALERLAATYTERGRPGVAELLFVRAEAFLEGSEAQHDLASLMNRRGLLLAQRGLLDDAIRLFEGACAIQQERGDPIETVRALNNVAKAQLQRHDARQARAPLERARALLEGQRAPLPRVHVLHNLGIVYHLLGEWDAARVLLDEAHAIADEVFARRMVAMVQISRASLEISAGKPREALPLLEEALAISQSLNTVPALFLGAFMLGRAHLLLGDLPQARRHLERAAHLAERHGLDDRNRGEALADLTRVYADEDRAEAAQHTLDEAAAAYAHAGTSARGEDSWVAARDALALAWSRAAQRPPAKE